MKHDNLQIGVPILMLLGTFVIGVTTKVLWSLSLWPIFALLVCGGLAQSAFDKISMEWTLRAFRKEMEKTEIMEGTEGYPQPCSQCSGDCDSAH